MTSILDQALALAATGLPVFPLNVDKGPCHKGGFENASNDAAAIRKAFAHPHARLIGVPTGPASGFDVLDVDPKNGGEEWFADNAANLPEAQTHRTRSGGLHVLFRHLPGVRNSGGRIAPGIDVRGEGGYVVWWPAHGFDVEHDGARPAWPDWLTLLVVRQVKDRETPIDADDLAPPTEHALIALLKGTPNPAEASRDDYMQVNLAVQGCIRGLQLDDASAVYDAAAEWSSRWDHPNASDVDAERAKWDSDWSQRDNDISGWPHLLGLAKRLGADVSKYVLASAAAEFDDLPPDPEPSPTVAAYEPAAPRTEPDELKLPPASKMSVNEDNEAAVARGFVQDMGAHIRFDHSADQWVICDERTGQWQFDKTGAGKAWIITYCRQARAIMGSPKSMASVSFVRAVEVLAKHDQRIAANASTWDQDDWILGTPAGPIDLRTGSLMPANPALFITKRTAVVPAAPGTLAPLWTAFLSEAAAGDQALIAMLYRWGGYCLTGEVNEEVLAFLYGRGGTGKTVFAGTLLDLLGTYGKALPADMLNARSRMNSEYALAELAGVRLALASETERDAPLAESLVKLLTGAEPSVRARRPYGHPFEYRPRAKLTITGNHLPQIGDASTAMKRRMRVLPLDHLPVKPDHHLKRKLIHEYPAILRLMIDGCIAWQKQRLGTCDAVESASEGYFEDQDVVGRWAEERLISSPAMQTKRSELYDDFRNWALSNGERPGTIQSFCEQARRQLGLVDKKLKHARVFVGAALQPTGDFDQMLEIQSLTA